MKNNKPIHPAFPHPQTHTQKNNNKKTKNKECFRMSLAYVVTVSLRVKLCLYSPNTYNPS